MKYPGLILIILGLAAFVYSQDAMTENLSKNRYNLKQSNGKLSGDGAEFLLKEAKNAQFFLIGEPHGISELPVFTSALFGQIYSNGYKHLAVETGPITARKMEILAAQSDGFSKFNYQFPFGLPFFNWKEEAQFLETAFSVAGKQNQTFWGLDQEFVASSEFHLQRLYELAPNEKAKNIVKEYYDNTKTEFKRVVETKNPTIMFLASAKAADFDKLNSAFAGSKNTEALEILSELRESAEIYDKNFTGKGYESNNQRAMLMKKHFTAYYKAAAKKESLPKVLFKLGANHVKRGRNFTNVYDIGNFVSELAASNSANSFHLLVIPTGGTQNTYVPFGGSEADKSKNFDALKAYSFADVSPLLKISDAKEWSIVDLRPLRPLIHSKQLTDLPDGFADLVWSYDAVLLLPNVKASTYFEWKQN